jgi:hypothetical protein
MDEIIQLVFKSYGLLGLLIIAPWVVVYFLWSENKSIHEEVSKSQTQRVTDAQEISKNLIAAAIEDSALKKETNLLLERMGETLDRLERS